MKKYDIDEKKKIEREWHEKGYKYVGGADEVGRGPLAGPVVCAAVILPPDCKIEGIDDSKKLSAKRREELYDEINKQAICISVAFVNEKEIDEINILNATKKCMAQAINCLKVKPDIMLIDALENLDISCPQKGIVHGDALVYSIGAASIVAKVTRDRFMDGMAEKYPIYGFEKHKGYGTKQHIDAIKKYGPCPLHRKSFLKNIIGDYE